MAMDIYTCERCGNPATAQQRNAGWKVEARVETPRYCSRGRVDREVFETGMLTGGDQ